MGYEITRFDPRSSHAAKIQRLLSVHQVDLVLDVGANVGQFARALRADGYPGRIVSFEPLSVAHGELLRLSKGDPSWTIGPQAAVGNEAAEVRIQISANSFSSSVLNMLESHRAAAPGSNYIGSETVRLDRLDTLAEPHLKASNAIFLKIDTQGFENFVLDGATKVLPKVKVLQTELAFVPLYEGQVLFEELFSRIRSLGFELFSLTPAFTHPETGRLLQVDGIFTMNRPVSE